MVIRILYLISGYDPDVQEGFCFVAEHPTDIEHLYGSECEWIVPNTGNE